MSKLDEKIALYKETAKKLKLNLSDELIEAVTRGLGPSIYNRDSETVACSDKSELERLRENFLKKKLGLKEPDEVLDKAIEEVCKELKGLNRKYRALFYALLAKKFKKEGVYLK